MGVSGILIVCATFLLSWWGTEAMRRYALARSMLDVPNARSSHQVPTPRGGGVAFVLSYFAALAALQLAGVADSRLDAAHVAGGGIVALLGLRDDRVSLSARVRLIWQCLAAVLAVCILGWGRFTASAPACLLFAGLMVFVLVASINFYNFMDGIDGLAISQAVFLSLGGAILMVLQGGWCVEMVVLAAASLGFCLLNWPPARIFMGDAGSGFLGFSFALFALYASARPSGSGWAWLILSGVFIVDAGFTLARRCWTGQRWHEAHRLHAYQKASRRFGAHRRVTLAVLGINVCWLLPLACVAQGMPVLGPWMLALAWSPLLALAVWLGAGLQEDAAPLG